MPILPRRRKMILVGMLLSILIAAGVAGAEVAGIPRSDWLESRKALHEPLLRSAPYDLLLVPFQVRGNAVDRPARSLMTRYLDDRIRRTTDLRIPGATLVSRALGETAREFDEKEVFRIADAMRVRYLLRGYVGHDQDLNMVVEILVQERRPDGTLSPPESSWKRAWRGVPFTDERPPEEGFRALLDNVTAALPLPAARKTKIVPIDNAGSGPVPPSLAALVAPGAATPLESAWRLQFLGLVAPRRIESGEPFFERSLVALEQVPPDAPGRALLRSRALFYLHRRPAAVAALPKPSTPEEKAFAAFLDADLPETTKRTEEIRSPLPRLFSWIEENDLRWEYDTHLPRQGKYEEVAGEFPEWKTLLTIRFRDRDEWDAPPNLLVKERMDKDFPVPGYTAETLATGRVMMRDSPFEGEEVELSVNSHFRKVMETRGKELAAADDSASPVERDALDLYASLGESNLAKLVLLRSEIQALPGEGLKVLDRIDGVYRGHPLLTWYRVYASGKEAERRQKDSRMSLLRTAREKAAQAFMWSGGQTDVARSSLDWLGKNGGDTSRLSAYDRDFPKRFDWNYSRSEDRKTFRRESLSAKNASAVADIHIPAERNADLGLLYTHTGIGHFTWYYDRFLGKKDPGTAGAFLAANDRRFAGSPSRVSFLARICREKGDVAGMVDVYEEAIRNIPEVWSTYEEYGDHLVGRGEIDNAATMMRKFPLFTDRKAAGRNDVAISNYAFGAGEKFWLLGEAEKAIPFFRIAADLETGSGAGMASAARIALSEEDYQRAAYHFLEGAKRYVTPGFIRSYISLLHAMGLGKQAWPVFDAVVEKVNTDIVWTAPIVGFRVDGAGDEEIANWFARDQTRKAAGPANGKYILPVFLVDRPPDPALAGKIREAERAGIAAARNENPGTAIPSTGDPSDMYEFYVHVRMKNWGGAVSKLQAWFPLFGKPGKHDVYAVLPYFAWLTAKSGAGRGSFDRFLDQKEPLDPFRYRLARAFLSGAEGRHAEAVEFLKTAYWRLPKATTLIDPWYQLVEACEWLFADSRRPDYRDLAVGWARKHQRIRPMDGWAYAVEAKHAENPADRLRALALTLYLDRRSERIQDVPEEEKKKAQEWLEKNNPFKIRKPKQMGA